MLASNQTARKVQNFHERCMNVSNILVLKNHAPR